MTNRDRVYAATVLTVIGITWSAGAVNGQTLDQPMKDQLIRIENKEDDLQKALNAITAKFAAKQDANMTIDVTHVPSEGASSATVAIVEFSDYQCPYCGQYSRTTFSKIREQLIRPGRIRYFLFDFPLTSIHQHAEEAAEAAHCAGEDGKYWAFHDLLFQHQDALDRASLLTYAAEAGEMPSRIKACLEEKRYQSRVADSVKEGKRVGVNATPIFFLGYVAPNGTSNVRVVAQMRGSVPYEDIAESVQKLLETPPPNGDTDSAASNLSSLLLG